MNKNSKCLLLTHCLKQIIQNFISTFLGVYFFEITNGDTIIVAKYYIVVYLFHIIFFYLIYKLCSRIKDIHVYRLSLIVKLIECSILLFLAAKDGGKSVIDYIYLIAILEGLSQSLYYTVYKTMITDISSDNYSKYFAFSRAGECLVGFGGGIVFGKMLAGSNINLVFIPLTIAAIASLFTSFFIRQKIKKKKNAQFKIVEFLKHTHSRHALYRVWTSSFCYGLGQGGLLAILVSLVINMKTEDTTTLGYISSAVSLFAILYSFLHKKYINESNFKERLLPASIILFFVAILLVLTGNIVAIVAFRFIAEALSGSNLIERNNITYELLPTITSPKYKKEYFYLNEVVLNISRIFGMFMIIALILITNNQDYLSYLFFLGTIGYFVSILIIDGSYKYSHIGPCKEAQEEMKINELIARSKDTEQIKN